MTDFGYQALNVESQEIRLIKASPPEHGIDRQAEISLTMYTVSLRDPPSYVALSYAWGEPQLICPVTCNSQRLMVTKNLARALRTTLSRIEWGETKKGESTSLWVDAICINQNDNIEKATQIPLMKDIYTRATYVIAYIGAPETTTPRDAYVACWELSGTAAVNRMKKPKVNREAMLELFSQPWFSRSWVYQEVVLPSKVLCLYGDETNYNSWGLDSWLEKMIDTMKLDDHNQEVEFVDSAPTGISPESIERIFLIINAWKALRALLRRNPDGLDPILSLSSGRIADAKDQRDKIYSFIGIFNKKDRNTVNVDYSVSNSTAKTFTDFAESYIRSGRGIKLLEHAGIPQRVLDLPSWVPDWTFESQDPLHFEDYSCAGSTRASVTLSLQPGKIRVRGWKFGHIAVLGMSFSYPSSCKVLAAETCAYIMCKSLADSKGYIRGEKFSDVIWRTLWLDRSCREGRRCNASDRRYYDAWLAKYPRTLEGYPEECSAPESIDTRRLVQTFMQEVAHIAGRAFCIISGGLFGMVPNNTLRGDVVAVFLGGRTPFVLRPIADTKEYQLVGPCYVHSVMDSELIDESGKEPRTVTGDMFEELLIR